MQPLDLYLKPSHYLTAVTFIAWVFVLGLCLTVKLPWWQALGFAIGSLWQAIIWLRRYAWLQSETSLRRIQVSVNGWRISFANGLCYNAKLASGCRFLPGLIVLRLALPSGRRLWWLLLADNADAQVLRRLRVWGRWGPLG